MEGEKKNLPTKSIDQKKKEAIKYVAGKAAESRAWGLVSNVAQVQVAFILKELHDDDNYKKHGYGTWDEVCEEHGVSRPHSYRLINNLKIAGQERMEFLYKAGISTYSQYLLLKGAGEIEDAEFEILSDDEIKINGKKFSARDNPEKTMECLFKLKLERDTEKRARRDIERELEEMKKDLENKKRTIQVGEQEQIKHERQKKGFQAETITKIGRIIAEMVYLAAAIDLEEVIPEDIPFLLRYLEMADIACYRRIVNKLSPHLPEDKDAI